MHAPIIRSELTVPTLPTPPCRAPQDFITGPASAATYGYFGIDKITGPGYAFATDAWVDAPEEPIDAHCIDSWTMIPVTVPVSGLTPYPADVKGQPDWSVQVVLTPVTLLTLGNTSEGSVADKFDAAYASVNVDSKGGLYGSGMLNSDPMVMLASSDAAKVGTGVAALVANAKSLGTLSLARALYECRDGTSARLSNELFAQARLQPRVQPGLGEGCALPPRHAHVQI